ncbi:MAG: MurR/RpiR family transcriptional regulator [Lachnospiraceae bacterium]|nr:MurR/RpiR family transcriptional regulator [Lachnospiraceae bacterium]
MFSYEVLQSFNNLEMLVYSYIMEHKTEIQYMTIRELADAVHVSTSTVIRFCRKTGCDGYSEFRVQFKMYLKQEKENRRKLAGDGNLDEITNFFRTVSSTRYEELLDRAAEMIQGAKQVIFIGIGTSGILGKYGARYFSNLGKYSQHIEDPYYPIVTDLEDTLVIALSESGETQEVIKLAGRFMNHGCRLLVITNGASCTLGKMADLCLTYYVQEVIVREEYSVTTQVPVLYILETLGKRSIF